MSCVTPSRARRRHRAQRRRVAGAAEVERAVEHEAAAEELAEEEVEEVALAPGLAEVKLRRAGGGRVVADDDAEIAMAPDLRADVDGAPAVHRAGRRAGLVRPAPKLERRRDAEPGEPRALAFVEPSDLLVKGARREGEHVLGRRIRIAEAGAATDRAGEIDQHEIARPPPDLQAQGEGAFGVDRDRHRRLADPAAQRRLALQQSFGAEAVHDGGGGLHREPGHARHFDLRQLAEATDQA